MDRFAKIAWFAFILITIFGSLMLIINGKTIKIDMVAPKSIYPCLDSFNLLITTSNITYLNYFKLIRVYASNSRHASDVEKLEYLREYKLPVNNLLKLDCQFFTANYRYYCFVFVALSRKTGAVLINGKPRCRPTTIEYEMSSTTNEYDNDYDNSNAQSKYDGELRPAGPSYKYNNKAATKAFRNNIFGNSRIVSDIRSKFDANYDYTSDSVYEDNAQLININCECNELFSINFNSVNSVIVSMEIVKCNRRTSYFGTASSARNNNNNNNGKSIGDINMTLSSVDANYATEYYYSSICVINFTENLKYEMRAQLHYREVPVIYTRSSPHLSLIVREGRLSIDPQLDISNKSQIHRINSQYLRIESYYSTNITVRLLLVKSDASKQQYYSIRTFFASVPIIHFASILLTALIFVSILALLLISLIGRKRQTVVTIVTPSDEEPHTHTSFSLMDQSTLSQFSLCDNQSLEMDYYDYLLPFVPRPHSRVSSDLRTNESKK